MVVTCPSCSARYKLPDSRVGGRGARVTCPKCRNAFVVRPESASQTSSSASLSEDPTPADAAPESPPQAAPESTPAAVPPPPEEPTDVSDGKASRNFQDVGITWHVRLGSGVTRDVHTLQQLLDGLADQTYSWDAALSYDMRSWRVIADIDDLPGWFDTIWNQAVGGQLRLAQHDEDEDEDEDDAATQLAGSNSALADEIRRALSDTPDPPAPREEAPPAPQAQLPRVEEPDTDPHADGGQVHHDTDTVPPAEERVASYTEDESTPAPSGARAPEVAAPAPAPAPAPAAPKPAPAAGGGWGMGAIAAAVIAAALIGVVVVVALR